MNKCTMLEVSRLNQEIKRLKVENERLRESINKMVSIAQIGYIGWLPDLQRAAERVLKGK